MSAHHDRFGIGIFLVALRPRTPEMWVGVGDRIDRSEV